MTSASEFMDKRGQTVHFLGEGGGVGGGGMKSHPTNITATAPIPTPLVSADEKSKRRGRLVTVSYQLKDGAY